MTGRTIRSRAELIATERLGQGMRSWRWQGQLRIHCFLPEKQQTSAATTEPYTAQSPAEDERQPRLPRLLPSGKSMFGQPGQEFSVFTSIEGGFEYSPAF